MIKLLKLVRMNTNKSDHFTHQVFVVGKFRRKKHKTRKQIKFPVWCREVIAL